MKVLDWQVYSKEGNYFCLSGRLDMNLMVLVVLPMPKDWLNFLPNESIAAVCDSALKFLL
jgi:hypothetical protein